MLYLVLVYPRLSEKDFEFIQNYRKMNDPKYFNVVDPHFTIVFATSNFTENDFVDEVVKQTNGIQKFDFKIRCATINEDDSHEYYHEFLVPDEGYSQIVKLHDKLYSGAFFDNLRFDIDFIPHIGVGNSTDVHVCKKNVDALNAQNVYMEGSVDTLDIVAYENNTITTIRKIELI